MSANTVVPGVLGAVVGAVLGSRVNGNGNGRYLAGALSGTASAVIAQTAVNHLSRRSRSGVHLSAIMIRRTVSVARSMPWRSRSFSAARVGPKLA
ncbi:glycine zipper 2TM domain-containing protein [Cupriavidus taiwanensis]|uniref:glycine zipper 2TM domain-containing protein n=2 Tax=Burkholderiaceae TaxID=119060 RepID=UPI001E5264DE|nr:glycine zipper 2TM domain-containing protein [Cupriavidus taiwanensis]